MNFHFNFPFIWANIKLIILLCCGPNQIQTECVVRMVINSKGNNIKMELYYSIFEMAKENTKIELQLVEKKKVTKYEIFTISLHGI